MIKIDIGQIQQIERDIFSQTYARDFMDDCTRLT